MTSRQKAYLALFITSFVWGTTWVVSKIAVQLIHPLFYCGIRQLVAGSLYLLFFMVRGKFQWPSLKEWGYLLLMSIIMFVISNGFTIWSVAYLSSGMGAVLGAISPLFVAVIDFVIGNKERPGLLSVIGLLLGFSGVAVIFSDHLSDFFNTNFLTGIAMALTAAFTWAIGTIITTRNKVKLDRYYALGWQMFLSGIIMYSLAWFNGNTMPLSEVPLKAYACIAYMIVFGSIIAFGAFIYTVTNLPPTLASIYSYLNPVVAVILGYLILKEPLTISLGIGALITLAGVFLVNKGFKKAEIRKAETS